MESVRMVVAGARYARGRLMGGSEGRALAKDELESLRALGCVNPARLLDSWWPGFGAVTGGLSK
jgi:hypothetical protein